MVVEIAGGKGLPAPVVEQIVSKTDGIPLFVQELTKMVLESAWMKEGDDHYELARSLPQLAIPATLHDSANGAVGSLGHGERGGAIGGNSRTRSGLWITQGNLTAE